MIVSLQNKGKQMRRLEETSSRHNLQGLGSEKGEERRKNDKDLGFLAQEMV